MIPKPLIFRTLAVQDIDEIAAYYIAEAGQDIALRFTYALQAPNDIVSRRPATGSPRLGHDLAIAGLRSRRLKRFPYLEFYVESDDRIEILRLLHAARDIPASLLDA